MTGHFPLADAVICVNCESVFCAQPRCPACQSDLVYPVAPWLSKRDGAAYEARALDELAGLRVTFPVAS